jgi:hypothetical protein
MILAFEWCSLENSPFVKVPNGNKLNEGSVGGS